MCTNPGGIGDYLSDRIGIGRKGIPRSIDKALSLANPNYGKGEEWESNCQRCIYAYEMLRRGYNVEALPRILNGYDEVYDKWKDVMKDAVWENVGSFSPDFCVKALKNKISQFGKNARAAIFVQWKSGNGAHVFIAEKKDNKMFFLDPQTGKTLNIDNCIRDSVPQFTEICRLDKLEPTDLIKQCVKKRGI